MKLREMSIVVLAVIVAAVLLGVFLMANRSGSNGSGSENLTATVALNAFHWGWVPEILESAPGVRVEIGPGAQGSQIIVPEGTKLRLILRNAGAMPEVHEVYEEQFEDFFIEKYGEAWRNAHQASHEADERETDDDHHDDEHESEETGPSMMDHSFLLEGYGVDVMLGHEHGEHEQIVELTLNRKGEFRFMCMNFCGIGHGDMQGTLVVTSDS